MNRRCFAVTAIGAVLLATAGCHHRHKGPEGIKVGLSLPDASSPYDQAIREAAQHQAEKEGFELHVEDARGKSSEQSRAIEQFVQNHVNVILVRPVEPDKIAPALQSASDGKISLVLLDQPVPGPTVATLVQFNQVLAGQIAADYLRDRLASGGKVGLYGSGSPDERERRDAFRAYLKEKAPKVTIVAEQSTPSDADPHATATSFLAAHRDLDAVFALNDAAGAALADAATKSAKPFIISYGGQPAMVERLKGQSPLALEIAAFPQRIGERASRMAWRIVSNKSTPGRIQLPPMPVVRDNAVNYPGWQGEVPADLKMPWKSDLALEVKREE